MSSLNLQERRPRRRRVVVIAWVTAALAIAVSATAAAVLLQPTEGPDPAPAQAAGIAPRPSASPTVPPAPPKPTQEELAAIPLAFYDGLIPALLDSTTIAPSNQWQVAVPNDPLVALYATRLRPELAANDMKRIAKAGVEKIHFAWAGGTDKGEGHYYRIHSPTVLIEYDNTQNDANHIHSVWRDLENDFGGDLLKKHYTESKH